MQCLPPRGSLSHLFPLERPLSLELWGGVTGVPAKLVGLGSDVFFFQGILTVDGLPKAQSRKTMQSCHVVPTLPPTWHLAGGVCLLWLLELSPCLRRPLDLRIDRWAHLNMGDF